MDVRKTIGIIMTVVLLLGLLLITACAGKTGVGIDSIVDNGDGTFTINLTDGSSFTSDDLTGPQGEQGTKGDKGNTGEQGPYLPDYDSGWVDITDKAGQYITIEHDLNYVDILVDITGQTTLGDSVHQMYLGLTSTNNPGWTQTSGGTGSDVGYSVVQTSNGGYTIVGYTNSFGAGLSDVYLVNVDAAGTVQWSQTYGGADYDYGQSVVQTSDGGYAIAGYTYSSGAGVADVYLIKTDSSGNAQWTKTFGGTQYDYGQSVVQTSDGGYAIAGYTNSFGAGSYDVYLIKTDAAGDAQWTKTFGGTGSDIGQSVVQTSDGGFAIAGYTTSFGAGGYDVYLIKADASGTTQWSQTWGGTNSDYGLSVVQTMDGGFATTGYSNTAGNYDVYLIKADASGTTQWSQTYGETDHEYGRSVVQTTDGGFAIAGYTSANSNDVYLVKTDTAGNELWTKTFGGTGYDYGQSVVQATDGEYTITGYSNSSGNYDVYIIKTGVEGEFGLARVGSTSNTLTLYRGLNDDYWNYVRVRIWKID